MIEHLIEKGVKKHFNGQIVLFAVESLNEHFDGLQIHDTDIVKIEQWDGDELVGTEEYIKASDVNFDGAVAKEVAPIEDESYENSEEGTKGIVTELSPEEANTLIKGMNSGVEFNDSEDLTETDNAKISIELTKDILEDNPELEKEGFEIGEIITVDAQEVKAEPIVVEVAPKVVEKVAKTPRFKK
jgi:hypothetical protein